MFFSRELSEVKWSVQVTETCSDVGVLPLSMETDVTFIHFLRLLFWSLLFVHINVSNYMFFL